ncbi:dienelactone hydrolase family protein [Amycolatopsis sp. NPDC058986]|uniref:dienelactone hydrolase family protein n=1 Tax=unclassified Amycolatopsis TaxID=2618356 RepID=UPI0036722068
MVTTKDIEYIVGEVTMVGRLALPDGTDQRPAVLIAHEGNGLSDRQRANAERLAELGYVAFALDYYGGGRLLTDRDEMLRHFTEIQSDQALTRARGAAGLDVLLAEPRTDPAKVAAIGYCFGGAVALELARAGKDLKAVVGFHASLSTPTPGDAANITGSVLICMGADDPIIPLDQRVAFEEEMRAGRVDWRMNLYGGAQHSFTNPDADPANAPMPGIVYHEASAKRSWRAMLDLFDEVLA